MVGDLSILAFQLNLGGFVASQLGPHMCTYLRPKAASSCDRVPEIACSATNFLALRASRNIGVSILGAACALPREADLVCSTNQIGLLVNYQIQG